MVVKVKPPYITGRTPHGKQKQTQYDEKNLFVTRREKKRSFQFFKSITKFRQTECHQTRKMWNKRSQKTTKIGKENLPRKAKKFNPEICLLPQNRVEPRGPHMMNSNFNPNRVVILLQTSLPIPQRVPTPYTHCFIIFTQGPKSPQSSYRSHNRYPLPPEPQELHKFYSINIYNRRHVDRPKITTLKNLFHSRRPSYKIDGVVTTSTAHY